MPDPISMVLGKKAVEGALAVSEHPAAIARAWEWIVRHTVGTKTTIAFTGMAGAGKTVLFDFLSGNAYRPGYRPPDKSEDCERGRRLISADRRHGIPKKRMALVVVPGDPSRPRSDTMDELFTQEHGVTGVVHVVCNGFVDIRSPDARAALIKQFGVDTVSKFTALKRQEEIEDVQAVSATLAASVRKYGRPKWMIVAVAKCDLYSATVEDAVAQYSPHFESPFSEVLKQMQARVGADTFRWEAHPICCWPEAFEWNGQVRPTNMPVAERDELVLSLLKRMEALCER